MKTSLHFNKNRSAGFFRLYAFFILAVIVVGYTAYYFGDQMVQKPLALEKEYQKYYTANDGAYYKYGTDPEYDGPNSTRRDDSPYEDSPANYPGAYNSAYNGDGSVVQTQTNTSPYSNGGAAYTNVPADALPPDNNQVANTPSLPTQPQVQAQILPEMDVFTSKINSRVSFSVPLGSQVSETGVAEKLAFVIVPENQPALTLNYSKESDGCYDPIYSFAIPVTDGVDYRILHEQTETAIKSTYRTLRVYEEYGTYTGKLGIRTNACIFSAVPTKVEIRASGYPRADIKAGFDLMGQILYSLKV